MRSQPTTGLRRVGASTLIAALVSGPLVAAPTATLARRALDAYRRGDFAEAVRDLETVYGRRPKDSVVAYDLGTAYAAAGRAAKAVPLLESAASANPALAAVARYQLGTLALGQAHYDEAVRQLTESLRRDPKSLAAKRNLEIALARRPPPKPSRRPNAGEKTGHSSTQRQSAQANEFQKKAGMTRAEAEALLNALEAESPTNRPHATPAKGEPDW
jgi:tetratricopeptide (TPR) repeat protein